MNITMNRAELLHAVKRASAVAPANSPLEALKGVLLEVSAASKSLVLTATNLEVTLKQKLALWLMDMSHDGKKVVMDMNREELADYLGVTRPSLSRSMAELKHQRIIRIEGKTVWIDHMEELEKIMEDE